MRRSGRSAALNFRNHFGGHSVVVADSLPALPAYQLDIRCHIVFLYWLGL